MLRAVRAIAKGGNYLHPSISGRVTGGFVKRRFAGKSGQVKLSESKTEIARQIVWRYSNQKIAATPESSVKTVEAHEANAVRKLDIPIRIDIVRLAMLQGWLADN